MRYIQQCRWEFDPSIYSRSVGTGYLQILPQKGASASVVIYIFVKNAKSNRLNVYRYLEYIFLYMSDTQWQFELELLEDLMSWDPDI